MPPTNQMIREEWNKRFEDAKFMVFDKENWDLIGDFWLSKFEAHEREVVNQALPLLNDIVKREEKRQESAARYRRPFDATVIQKTKILIKLFNH